LASFHIHKNIKQAGGKVINSHPLSTLMTLITISCNLVMKLHCFCVINQLTTTTTKHESSLLLLGKKKLGMSKVSMNLIAFYMRKNILVTITNYNYTTN
jgi:hypothetical protein